MHICVIDYAKACQRVHHEDNLFTLEGLRNDDTDLRVIRSL